MQRRPARDIGYLGSGTPSQHPQAIRVPVGSRIGQRRPPQPIPVRHADILPRLAQDKGPRSVAFTGNLPLSARGMILKRTLRERVSTFTARSRSSNAQAWWHTRRLGRSDHCTNPPPDSHL